MMLTAKTKAGKKISLGYPYKKETLQSLRKQEEFFCPVCGERVLLKLGEKKIFHFAHKSGGACREFIENETQSHMKGKLQLFQWLRGQGTDAVLEYYDKEIKQRPDIAFQIKGQKFALEYQCSTVSEQIFIKRTNNYLQKGYIPLWILGDVQLKQKQPNTVSLTNFHYLFLRETSENQMFFPFFSSETNRFSILSSLFPYTTQYSLTQKSELSLQEMTFSTFTDPVIDFRLNPGQWRKLMDKHQWNWSMHEGAEQKVFFNELYTKYMNPFLLPIEIGIPVHRGLLIHTLPFVWQTYFYLDVLRNKHPGEIILLKEIKQKFGQRVASGKIRIRNIPLVKNSKAVDAAVDYMFSLEKIGITASLGNGNFRIIRPLAVPLSNRERAEMSIRFQSQIGGKIVKNK